MDYYTQLRHWRKQSDQNPTYGLQEAYDSAAKNATRVSEAQTGVPTHHSNCTVETNMNGRTVIKSAVSEENFRKNGYIGFSTENREDTKKAFTPGSEMVQRDVDSPNKWKRLFGIILTAIRLLVPDGFF